MNFFNEFGLLVAVSLPVVVIVGMQVFLFITGERGSGLIPGLSKYPSIEFKKLAAAPQPVVSEVPTILITIKSSNDEEERLAA